MRAPGGQVKQSHAAATRRPGEVHVQLTVKPEQTRGALGELAKVFGNDQAARQLLEDAGVPLEHVQPFGHLPPMQYWRSVAQVLENGLIAGGMLPVLDQAARQFPYNPVFARFGAVRPGTSRKLVVLFLGASPDGLSATRTDRELSALQRALAQRGSNERVELQCRPVIRPDELIAAVLETQPVVLHFGGHGTKDGHIVFESHDGEPAYIAPEVLCGLLEILGREARSPVRCAVLSACYAAGVVARLTSGAEAAVGPVDTMSNVAAVSFALGFYTALANGQSVATSVELGVLQMEIDSVKNAPEMQLHVRAGVDARKLLL